MDAINDAVMCFVFGWVPFAGIVVWLYAMVRGGL